MANSVVFAIFSSKGQMDAAVDQMKQDGFQNSEISVLFPFTDGVKNSALEKGTKANEAAMAGAVSGAIISGAFGWLAGIGMVAIPGMGPFAAAGPIAALLSVALLGAAGGGLAGALIGIGIPEFRASRCEEGIKGGSILLSVHAHDCRRIAKAKTILETAGADDIASTGESTGE